MDNMPNGSHEFWQLGLSPGESEVRAVMADHITHFIEEQRLDFRQDADIVVRHAQGSCPARSLENPCPDRHWKYCPRATHVIGTIYATLQEVPRYAFPDAAELRAARREHIEALLGVNLASHVASDQPAVSPHPQAPCVASVYKPKSEL